MEWKLQYRFEWGLLWHTTTMDDAKEKKKYNQQQLHFPLPYKVHSWVYPQFLFPTPAIASEFLACMRKESWIQPRKPRKNPFLTEFSVKGPSIYVKRVPSRQGDVCRRTIPVHRPPCFEISQIHAHGTAVYTVQCSAHWRSSSLEKNLEK